MMNTFMKIIIVLCGLSMGVLVGGKWYLGTLEARKIALIDHIQNQLTAGMMIDTWVAVLVEKEVNYSDDKAEKCIRVIIRDVKMELIDSSSVSFIVYYDENRCVTHWESHEAFTGL